MKIFLSALLVTQLLSGCGSGDEKPAEQGVFEQISETLEAPKGFDLSTSQMRHAPQANEQELKLWVETLNKQAISDSNNKKNHIIYPYAQAAQLTALLLAADNYSAEAIADELFLSDSIFRTNESLFYSAFNHLDQKLNSAEFNETTFSSATSFWGQDDYPFASIFVDNSIAYLGAELNSVNFKTNKAEAVEAMKKWFAEHAGELADELFIAVNDNTELMIAQAQTVNAFWQSAFDESKDEQVQFTLLSEKNVEVSAMRQQFDALYYSDDQQSIIEMPLANDEWALYLVTTNDLDHYSNFMDEMTKESLQSLIVKMSLSSVDFTVPYFKEGNSNSVPRVGSIYDKEAADFSTLNQQSHNDLYITNANAKFQLNFAHQGVTLNAEAKNIFEIKPEPQPVNNSGNSSYGVTISADGGSSTIIKEEPVVVDFNSPFKYFFIHKTTNLVLISGNVVDPRDDF